MTWSGQFAEWPAGPDYVASAPALFPAIDRKLSMLGLTVQSQDDLRQKVPSPGANERWTVRCPPQSLTWTWDGTRWLTWDDQPKTYATYWYDGVDDTPLTVGTGTLQATYQRRGHWCDMTMVTSLGDGGNVGQGGSEKWYWYLQYAPIDMYQVGKARIRLADTREWSGAVGTINNNRIYVSLNGARLNKDVVPWDYAVGNQVLMQMTYRMRV